MLLVVTYSTAARQSLRNACDIHEEAVVRRFGRAALLEETELGAFLSLRLRERHADDIQVQRTRPFNEFAAVPKSVREAARAYEDREHDRTPYAASAAGTDHPDAETIAERPLADADHSVDVGTDPDADHDTDPDR